MRQLKETLLRQESGVAVGHGPVSENVRVRGRQLLQKRRVETRMEAFQGAAGAAPGHHDGVDDVTVAMLQRGPDMFIPPEAEIRERLHA